MSQYTNLPGVNLEVMDGQLLMAQDTTSNSILIIAEAKTPSTIEAPAEPVLVRTEKDLRDNFGGFFRQGELNPIAAEWVAARRSGFRNIYLLALSGEGLKNQFVFLQDMLFNIVTDMGIGSVVLSGMYADEYVEALGASDFGEDIKDLDEVEGISVVNVRRALSEAKTLELSGVDNEPVTLTVKAGENEVVATIDEAHEPEYLVAHLNNQIAIGAGELGLNLEVVFSLKDGNAVVTSSVATELQGAEVLTALSLTDVEGHIEGQGSPAEILGKFAERQSNESSSLIAYIGVKPAKSTSLVEIRKHHEALIKRDNQISRYVQVIAGPPVGVSVPGNSRAQWVSGATQYAGLVNKLAPQVATTNQPLGGVNGLRYNLSLRQLDQLVGNKYVTFRVKNNQIIVVDGVTSAPDLFAGDQIVGSDFTRLSTLRTTNYMVTELRTALDAFIGQPNEFPLYNAMNTAIKGVIRDAISDAIVQDAKYTIRMGDTLDSSIVDLTILPQFELRTIDVSIGLSTPENFVG